MAAIGNQYKIERGDCAWNVASKTLKAVPQGTAFPFI